MFQYRWLRQLFRRHTKPIAEARADLWKRRLSFAYAFIAWNAFGVVCYLIYNGKADWARYYGYKSEEEASLTPAQQWTKTLRIKDATVYRISGLRVEKYEVHNDFDDDNKTKSESTEETIVENDKSNIN